MITKYRYTDGELKRLLSSIVIMIDSREQINKHIVDYLNKHNIQHICKKLDFGDYSCMVPANSDLGFSRNVYFDGSVAIERKSSLEELSGNFTRERTRFETEMIRASHAKLFLMIENASYEDVILHRYNTKYDPKSFIATLKTFEIRHKLDINFISKACAGNYIYTTFYYYLREYFKK